MAVSLGGYLTSAFEVTLVDIAPSPGSTISSHPELTVVQSIAAPPGTASPAAAAVSFPTPVAVGTTTQSAPMTFTNTGLGPMAFTGTNTTSSPDFSASGTCFGAATVVVIQLGGTCTITITFAPTASTPTGTPLSETLIAQTDGTTNVTFTLTGTAAPGGVVQLNPNPFTFPNPVRIGQSQSITAAVTLTNTGTGPVHISGVSNATDFSAAGACLTGLPVAVGPGGACTIDLTFAPLATTAPGSLSETITIATDAGNLTLTVRGTGTAPAVTLSPASVSFGAVNVGTPSAAASVTLTNSGTATLTITAISVAGANAADFQQSNNCPTATVTLAAGASCTITITFTPSATGNESASVQITDNAAGSPQTVSLSGTGASTAAGFTFTVPTTPSGGNGTTVSVLPGDTAVFTLVLQPNPGFIGTISIACMSGIPATIATGSPTTINVTTSPSPAFTIACTLQTNCVAQLLRPRDPWSAPGPLGPPPAVPLEAMGGLALLVGIMWRCLSQRWVIRLAPALVLLLLVMTWAGCVSNPPPAIPNAPTTPAGVYQIQVVATAPGGVKQVVTLNVHVI